MYVCVYCMYTSFSLNILRIEYLSQVYVHELDGPGKSSIPWTLKGDFAVTSSVLAAQVRGFAGYDIFFIFYRSYLTLSYLGDSNYAVF